MKSSVAGQFIKIIYDSCLPPVLDGLLPTLDAEEVAYVRTRGLLSSQIQSAAVMNLAHQLTGSHIRRDSAGRPYCVDSAFDISLSHKDGAAVAAVAPFGLRLGVDLEKAEALHDSYLFARHALTAGERQKLDRFGAHWKASRAEAVVILWSLKECLFKASGVVVNPGLIEFAITEGELSQVVRMGDLDLVLAEAFVHRVEGHFITALALRDKDKKG